MSKVWIISGSDVPESYLLRGDTAPEVIGAYFVDIYDEEEEVTIRPTNVIAGDGWMVASLEEVQEFL